MGNAHARRYAAELSLSEDKGLRNGFFRIGVLPLGVIACIAF